nr:MAG TPA: hypothetical protein [Caudoviricetes sp.]DAX90528.1 MAG TPA: hypothetical protein [Caudoviricetes sp.]
MTKYFSEFPKRSRSQGPNSTHTERGEYPIDYSP